MKSTNPSFEIRLIEQGLIEAYPKVVEFGESLQVFGEFLDSTFFLENSFFLSVYSMGSTKTKQSNVSRWLSLS